MMHFPGGLFLLFKQYLGTNWRQNIQMQMTQLSTTAMGRFWIRKVEAWKKENFHQADQQSDLYWSYT